MAESVFKWGKKIKEFSLDFDGRVCDVVKYHHSKLGILYFCDEIHRSDPSMEALILYWFTERFVGNSLYNGSLVEGIRRALRIDESK